MKKLLVIVFTFSFLLLTFTPSVFAADVGKGGVAGRRLRADIDAVQHRAAWQLHPHRPAAAGIHHLRFSQRSEMSVEKFLQVFPRCRRRRSHGPQTLQTPHHPRTDGGPIAVTNFGDRTEGAITGGRAVTDGGNQIVTPFCRPGLFVLSLHTK